MREQLPKDVLPLVQPVHDALDLVRHLLARGGSLRLGRRRPRRRRSRLPRASAPAPEPRRDRAVGRLAPRRQRETTELGEGAEILEGTTEEMSEKLIELLKAKGGIK